MLAVAVSARSPMLSVVPVIRSAIKASISVQFFWKSTKSGQATSGLPGSERFVPAIAINLSWWATAGNGRSRMPSIQLKTAAFAPIPSVRQRIATIEKLGLRRNIRKPKRRSCHRT